MIPKNNRTTDRRLDYMGKQPSPVPSLSGLHWNKQELSKIANEIKLCQ